MKKRTLVAMLLMAITVGLLTTCEDNAAIPTATIESTSDSLSYAWGVQLAEALKQRANNLDPDVVAKAVKEALEENAQMDLDQCRQVVATISNRERQEAMTENAEKGKAFLEENAGKPGVMTTTSGLQYKIIKEGTGESPTISSTVTVHYTGKFIDGSEFESSRGGNPATFPLGRVIPGWTEGLQLVKQGGIIELYIPSELAYGVQGSGARIGPNSTLVFEVELLSFE